MKAILSALLFVAAVLQCHGGTVERAGYAIAVPDGWKIFAGTCTGDAIYEKDGCSLSIGRRRYVDSSEEFLSSADVYRFTGFDDLESVVSDAWKRLGGSLSRRMLSVSESGKHVLRLEFSEVEISGRREFVTCVFVEDAQGSGVLEVRLMAVGSNRSGDEALRRALLSIGVKEEAQPGATDNPGNAQ